MQKGETMLKLWTCSATYSDGRNEQYYGCLIYAECADDAFRYLDERARDLGLFCLCKSVQRDDRIYVE